MRTLVIEPHGDDALISAWTALKGNLSIDLLTCAERSSAGLRDHLSDECVCMTTFLDQLDINLGLRPKVDTHEVNRLFKNGEDVSYYRELTLSAVLDNIELYNSEGLLAETLLSKLATGSYYDFVLVPVGLDHPYHVFISDMIHRLVPVNTKLIRYVDKPYIAKRYCKQILECWSKNNPTLSVMTVRYNTEESNEKRKVFASVYPTEQSLLRFTSDSILIDPDIYFGYPSDLQLLASYLTERGFNCEINDCYQSKS